MSSSVAEISAQPDPNSEALVTKYTRQLTVLQELNHLINSEAPTENVVQAALNHLLDTLDYQAAQIYRLSPSGLEVWLDIELGSGGKPFTQNTNIFSIEEKNVISDAIRHNQPVYVPTIGQGPYAHSDQDKTVARIGSELALPLTCGQLPLGALKVESSLIDDFDQADLSFLASLANLLASTIKNRQSVLQLEKELQEIKIRYGLPYGEERPDQQLAVQNTNALPGYQYDRTTITPARTDELPPSATLTIPNESVGVSTIQNENLKALIAPIKTYGKTIGVLGVEDTPDTEEWSTDDIRLLEEISSQVALAVENSRLLQQTQERTQELSILFETSRQLSETIDLHHSYEILATQIINYLNADTCSVSLLNRARTHFEEIVTQSKQGGRVVAARHYESRLETIEDSSFLQQLVEQPRFIITHHPSGSTHLLAVEGEEKGHQTESKAKPGIHTLAIFPLIVRNNLAGILRVGHFNQYRSYTQNEQQLAQAIISQVTVAIENIQLFEQTQNTLAETQRLYDISRSLVEVTTLEEIFDVVIANVKIYNVDQISIVLLEQDPSGKIEQVRIAAGWDKGTDQLLPVDSQISTGMLPLVEAFARPPFHPLISENLSQAQGQDVRLDEAFRQFLREETGIISLFAAPMFVGAEYKGVLSISTRAPHNFSQQERRIYQTLADQAIIAIERHHLFEATRRERDRAALLYEFGQRLSQTTTVDEVKETVLSFTQRVGAKHGEIYISASDYQSMGSTIPGRQRMSPEAADQLTTIVLTQGLEAEALKTQKIIVKNKGQSNWAVEGLPDPVGIQSILCAPLYSRRADLQGVLTFFHPLETGFTEEHIAMFESMATQTSVTLENMWHLRQTAAALSETELLYSASRDFNSAQHVEDLLAALVTSFASPKAQAETGIDHMAIVLISALAEGDSPGRLAVVADWDKENATLQKQILVPNPDFQIISDDYPFIKEIDSAASCEIRPDQGEDARAFLTEYLGKAHAALAIPLTVGNNWLGILFIASRIDGFIFKPDTVNQIATLAGQVAVVIQNLQLVEETQQNLYNSEILSHLSQELLVADTTETIYSLTLEAIAATEPSRGAAIFMYDQLEGGVELEIVAVWDSPSQEWPPTSSGIRFSAEDLGLGPLLKTGQTIITNTVPDDERFSAELKQLLETMQIKSLVAVPIWLNKEVNGFILIGNHRTIPFSLETIRLYENIARLVSGALENRRLFEEAQYRAAQLQTAAEVSQAVASYLELDRLLSESVYLLRDRFGFYHVSIFLVDEYQQYALVLASTGEIGRQMVAMKYKLKVGGPTIVGAATATGKPRIALDVGKDDLFFDDPLLPDTHSEMALPLIARGRTIGALEVHSIEKGAFQESDIGILQAMANQLANAIEAARAVMESKRTLEEVSKLHEHYLRDEWSTFLREQKAAPGYRLVDGKLITTPEGIGVPDSHRDTLQKAFEAKRPLIVARSLSPTKKEDKNGRDRPPQEQAKSDSSRLPDTSRLARVARDEVATLIAPLILQQAIIGAVDFEVSETEKIWQEDTLRIIEEVTSQAAQAIEAARLFEQTQVAREEAETLYQVGQALIATDSEQEMFHTVLSKTLSTLGLQQGGILFFEQDKKFGNLYVLFEEGKPVQPNLRIPIEGNLSYQKLIETKRPLAIEDVSNDPLLASVRDINRKRNIASILLVPIIINDEVVGSMGADALGQKRSFTEREINLVSAMVDQLSIMLQNRRLLEETRRRAIQLQTSADVGRVATSILDQDVMLSEAVELIKNHFGFYHAQIFLISEDKQYALLHKSTGQAGQQLLAANYKVAVGEQNVIGQVAYHRKSLVVRDNYTGNSNLSFQRHEFLPSSRAELAIPLQVGETLIGVLDVHSTSGNDFAKEDIATMEILGAQLAIAIQNARAFREQQETAQRLKEIDKLKTQFLANMSHELRTPLNSIIGFSRVILKGIDGPLTELQKADLTSIHNSGQHLLGLINNILDLSKIGAGKMELNFEEVEISSIVKGIMATALALVKDKPVKLIQEIPDSLPIVWADPTRLRQIILNLVSNACKFTDEGSVTVQVVADKEKIIFSVSDTGIGIPEDNLESVFEEFTQVDASTTRKVGGTGLGLPISRHFVEMHKGQIWVESRPGKGSTFSFAIPVKPSPETSEILDDLSLAVDEETEQNKTVVAIDDDANVITLYQRFLEKQHYKVIGINNGDKIIDRVRSYTPFAILLDVLMPNKDGWSILKALKGDPFTKDIPVIICSIVNDRNRGFSLGAADYLTKPIMESELVNAIKHLHNQQKEQVKVLVIDDQADDILLIRRILEAQSNYKIIEASNGREGLELVKTRNPDLIVLDLTMPEMDGFTVIEVLKNDEKTKIIPIVIVSARELSPAEHKRLTGQVEVFLRKGIFTENELLEDVRQALERCQKKETI